jgi:hypothetical protein
MSNANGFVAQRGEAVNEISPGRMKEGSLKMPPKA